MEKLLLLFSKRYPILEQEQVYLPRKLNHDINTTEIKASFDESIKQEHCNFCKIADLVSSKRSR